VVGFDLADVGDVQRVLQGSSPPGPNPRAWVSPWPPLAGGYLRAPTVIGYKSGYTAAIRQAIFNV
jgi:hypothetical protein